MMMKKDMKRKKGAIQWDTLIPWIIGAGILFIIVGGIIVLRIKGINAIDYVKTLLKIGR